jgi:divalent metal cation (Fe/Co/Zn/Cd) transporter
MGRAQRPADEAHPFGYGMGLCFWTFMVAVLLFSVGAGMSLYEGVMKICTLMKLKMLSLIILFLELHLFLNQWPGGWRLINLN